MTVSRPGSPSHRVHSEIAALEKGTREVLDWMVIALLLAFSACALALLFREDGGPWSSGCLGFGFACFLMGILSTVSRLRCTRELLLVLAWIQEKEQDPEAHTLAVESVKERLEFVQAGRSRAFSLAFISAMNGLLWTSFGGLLLML